MLEMNAARNPTKSFKQREELQQSVHHLDVEVNHLEKVMKEQIKGTRHLMMLGLLLFIMSLSVTCIVVFTRELHADENGVLSTSDGKHIAAALAVSTKELNLETLTTTPLEKINEVSLTVEGGVVGFKVTRYTAIDGRVTLFGADSVQIQVDKNGMEYYDGKHGDGAGAQDGRRLWGWSGWFSSSDENDSDDAIEICSLGSCKHGDRPWWKAAWTVCDCNTGWEGKCCDAPVGGCTSGSASACPQSSLEEKSFPCADVTNSDGVYDGPLVMGGKELPAQLQGIFWLQQQKDSSSLVSFGKTNDGGGISPGKLPEVVNGVSKYSVRVGGDRQWSFNDKGASWSLVELADLVYHFHFNSATNPTSAQIIAEGVNIRIRASWTWLLDFSMTLYADDDVDKPYKDSVVWKRNSGIAGQEITSKYYEVVQVIDGDGKPIQPAFGEWQEYCKGAEQGDTPGHIWFHQAK